MKDWITAIEQEMNQPATGAVMCGQCYFYDTHGRTAPAPPLCWHPHAQYAVVTHAEAHLLHHAAAERNAHNDCPDFTPYHWTWAWFQREEPGLVLLGVMLGAGVTVGCLLAGLHFLLGD